MYGKQTGQQAFEEAQRRLMVLENRRMELEEEIGSFVGAEDAHEEIAELEIEIEEFELLLEERRKEVEVMNEIDKLQTIEKAAVSAGPEARALRKRAEVLYDEVVANIMERDGCDESTAHVRASNDPIGKQAYATIVEMQESELTAREGAYGLAAYLA